MAHPEFCPTLNPSTGVCMSVAVIGHACCSKNKNTGQALVSSHDLSVPVAGPLDTRPQLWPCTRVSDKSVSSWRLWEAVSLVQGTRLGYPVACLALTKHPGSGSWALPLSWQPQFWFPLAGLESLIAWASVPASIAWPELWSLQIRTLIWVHLFFPITYLKCRPSWEFAACPLSCLNHTASLGHLRYSPQYLPTIPPLHFSTAKNHICSTSGTSTFYCLPDLNHHITFDYSEESHGPAALSAFQTSAHRLWLGTNYKAYLTAGWQEDSVVWWMSMP